ncbi:MAG: CoA pyrophosphatase [Pseudomonadota bacterium]|nr:CoA pyrophosphatase [Pseudomonadota bacterium]
MLVDDASFAVPKLVLNQISENLASYDARLAKSNPRTREAAVALILRPRPSAPEHTDILFIKRAEKEGDPWSGHMAFPGGHRETSDDGLRGAAMRETAEEIGLDLGDSKYLGALDHEHANPRGRVLNMLIAPHVFQIQGDPELAPNHEVAEVVWAPLNVLAENTLHSTETMPMSGRPTIFNGYRLERGHFVWGLTYRILKSFFSTVDPNWQPPKEVD